MSLNLFKWHHYECLNNPISSNLALCTACCCSINSSSGLTREKPDQKITILVFRLVLQIFAHPAFFPCILCYPNLIISPYFLLVVLLLQYVALSISVQGTSYGLVVINWCRVAISNDKSTLCALTFLCFLSWHRLWLVDCVLSLLSVHAIGRDYLAVQMGVVWVIPGSRCSGVWRCFSIAAISEWKTEVNGSFGGCLRNLYKWWHETRRNYLFINLNATKMHFCFGHVLEEWPEACCSLNVVSARIMHGFGTDPIRNPTIWLLESWNQDS